MVSRIYLRKHSIFQGFFEFCDCFLRQTPKLNKVFRYSPFTVGVSSAGPPCNQLENVADTSGSSKSLERWEDSDVRLLITTWADHKQCQTTHPGRFAPNSRLLVD